MATHAVVFVTIHQPFAPRSARRRLVHVIGGRDGSVLPTHGRERVMSGEVTLGLGIRSRSAGLGLYFPTCRRRVIEFVFEEP